MNKIRTLTTQFISLLVLASTLGLVAVPDAHGQVAKSELPGIKQTNLGLYATAKKRTKKWKTTPEKIKILDVRTPEEYLFVGHPAMTWNIPLFLQTYEWDPEKRRFPMKPNPDFLSRAKGLFTPDDTLLVMCRSGGRSALAVNQLAEAGFRHVYNITDGMEGDMIDDPESVFRGQRMKNGWKNSGLPWTYHIDPELMCLPKSQ